VSSSNERETKRQEDDVVSYFFRPCIFSQVMDNYYHSEPIYVSAISISAPVETVYSSFPSKICQNDGNLREFLTQKRWPDNMQTVFIQNVEQLPIRFFICDDSGSMSRDDGTVITEYQGKFK
jgi:hypothetical protein